ncbi:uncharacterized membrane protein HdeD (DUF308 family) [Caldalkalibacillus uzonensis]|uniref:Uncharacterized membrane protein HdeD (DUF308 family) n=1 Tax=Caldalkalibacillus uzonensis TaxID=353224 RepID=A0ABU0CQG2_9BACI|nr:hypothetical protein [Caldalkalibacillus uzonensis]MDQ0338397.1 uncharacterized membrane protein HdeD (DUF308 family) [Caldalkalibacillus uzonensis]
MSEETRRKEAGLNKDIARWTGWIGIIVAVIGLFFAPFWLGGTAVVLGIITLFSPMRTLAWWSIVLGIVAIGIGFFFTGGFTPPA